MSEQAMAPEEHRLADDGWIPNNPDLPLLLYRKAAELPADDPACGFEVLFRRHGWGGSWRNGIYGYHHFHSTAHEVLGIARGTVRVKLGGEQGITADLGPGDVVVIPAGVAHACIEASDDFAVVGAYPNGSDYDTIRDDPGALAASQQRIAQVPVPDADPVDGADGPLVKLWT
jgi:uncharacterized protein YjlB